MNQIVSPSQNDSKTSPEEPDIILPNRPVGGWLYVLIFGLAFLTPGTAQLNITETKTNYAPYLGRFPTLENALNVYSLLNWSVIVVSLYTAYLLAFKKPGAVIITKRGLILMVAAILLANFSIPLLAALPKAAIDELLQFAFRSSVQPLAFLAVWYTYLVRSKRVKETYAS
jgi:hypothetical protein